MINPFQLIVNALQKQPHEICHELAKVLMLATPLYIYFSWELSSWGLISFAVNLIWAILIWNASESAEATARIGRVSFACLVTLLTLVAVFAFIKTPDAKSASRLFYDVTLCLIYWFACCKPPAPPKRKVKADLKFA